MLSPTSGRKELLSSGLHIYPVYTYRSSVGHAYNEATLALALVGSLRVVQRLGDAVSCIGKAWCVWNSYIFLFSFHHTEVKDADALATCSPI